MLQKQSHNTVAHPLPQSAHQLKAAANTVRFIYNKKASVTDFLQSATLALILFKTDYNSESARNYTIFSFSILVTMPGLALPRDFFMI